MSDNKTGFMLYFSFLSQPSRALYILLKASGAQFEEHQIDLLAGEHTTDEFKQNINRFQKVPAIIDADGFKLAESVAILRYLYRRGAIDGKFYPSLLRERALCDEFLQWQHMGVRSSCSLFFRFTWLQAHIFGAPADAGKVAKYKNEMERDLALIERVWLYNSKFLGGNATATAADVFGVCEIEQLKFCGYNVREKFPRIADWIQDVRDAFSPHFDVAHALVYHYERQTKAKL